MIAVAAIGLALNVACRHRAPARRAGRSQRARGAVPRARRCARRAGRHRRRHRDRRYPRAWIDPALSLLVAAIIVAGVVRVVREATNVLLESVPGDVDSAALVARLERVGGRRRRARPARLDDRQRVARARRRTSCSTTAASARRPASCANRPRHARRLRHRARHDPVRVRDCAVDDERIERVCTPEGVRSAGVGGSACPATTVARL